MLTFMIVQACNVDMRGFVGAGSNTSHHDGSSQDVYHSVLSDLPIPDLEALGESLLPLKLFRTPYSPHVIEYAEWRY